MRCTLAVVLWLLAACEGPVGPAGPPGANGSQGSDGSDGSAGQPGGPAPWLTAGGVRLTIDDLAFADASATVAFHLDDGAGVALDKDGRLTTGTVEVGFVLAQLAKDPSGEPAQYTAYTTRIQTPSGASATQGAVDAGGTLEVVKITDGSYRYKFAASAAAHDAALVQTVTGYVIRRANGAQVIASTTRSFGASGSVATPRAVVTDARCDGCHNTLSGHGGRYTAVSQCVLCHTPQSSDPDTGNTVDFRVMIHKIHRGAALPSVIGGTPYRIIGFGQSVHDFSTVEFPQNVARCTACHEGAQADYWKTRVTKDNCLSCHDNIAFQNPVPTGMVLHGGGTQPSNAPCTVCHPAAGGIAGVVDKHLTGLIAPNARELELTIDSMTQTAPGQLPVMTFTAMIDDVPVDLTTTPLTSLRATVAGPNTDFATFWQATIQGSGATGTLTYTSAGHHQYAFPAAAAIPAAATGSYTAGLEGYLTQPPRTDRFATVSPMLPFAVTGTVTTPRRMVVDPERCNACHSDLNGHGGSRKGAQYCTMCHNPNKANDERIARFEGSTVLAETVDFKVMIHKIHAGEELSAPYVLYGFPVPTATKPGGSPLNFAETRYPRARTQCVACHAAGTFGLPLAATVLPSTSAELTCTEPANADGDTFCTAPFWNITRSPKTPPTTAVCTSCHDQVYVAVHALLNTSPAGLEACATCHGPDKSEDVLKVHGSL
jgi:OmcA/MtrC family decaheme c-type cytochrome